MNENKEILYQNKDYDFYNISFQVRNTVDAIRRGDDDIDLTLIKELLFRTSKPVIYTYLGVLRSYGYTYDSIVNLWTHYFINFLYEVEFPIENVTAYYLSYIKHSFNKVINRESTEKRGTNFNPESMDSDIDNVDGPLRKMDRIISQEDIPQWYSGSEIITEYIRNTANQYLSDSEKEIVDQKIYGNSFSEISCNLGISYKQVHYMYESAIKKLRILLTGVQKSLQN